MSNWYERWSAGEHVTPQPVDEAQKLKEDLEELQSTFNLIWKAQQRAIQMWQQKTGQGLNWPDKASLIVWLMEENESLRKQCDDLMQTLADIDPREEGCTCPILQIQGSSCPLHGLPTVAWSEFCKDKE